MRERERARARAHACNRERERERERESACCAKSAVEVVGKVDSIETMHIFFERI